MNYSTLSPAQFLFNIANANMEITIDQADNQDLGRIKNTFGEIQIDSRDTMETIQDKLDQIKGYQHEFTICIVRYRELEYGRSYNAPLDVVSIGRTTTPGTIAIWNTLYSDNKSNQRGTRKLLERGQMLTKYTL